MLLLSMPGELAPASIRSRSIGAEALWEWAMLAMPIPRNPLSVSVAILRTRLFIAYLLFETVTTQVFDNRCVSRFALKLQTDQPVWESVCNKNSLRQWTAHIPVAKRFCHAPS